MELVKFVKGESVKFTYAVYSEALSKDGWTVAVEPKAEEATKPVKAKKGE